MAVTSGALGADPISFGAGGSGAAVIPPQNTGPAQIVSGATGLSGGGPASAPVPPASSSAPPASPGIRPADFFTLVMADFQGEYQVYIAAASERVVMLRFALSLLAAPFAATIALVSAKVVHASSLASWAHIPGYLFGLLAAFGLLAILPYLRMIEASITHVRTARAMNNFRLLYARGLHDELTAWGWSPNLPVDPSYPESFAPLSWPGINAVVLALLEAAYITVGVVGLARVRPAPLLIAFGIAAVTLLLFGAYYVRTNISRRRREPANPLGFPRVETL